MNLIREPASDDIRRLPPLEGGHNFRDLGGYGTADGRCVRWGRIFRSGGMDKFTSSDYRHLARIGIRSLCDLRSNRERLMMAIELPEELGIDYWARDYDGSSGDLIAHIKRAGTTADEMRTRMIDAYRRLPYEQAPAYRELFHRAANGALPLVFNCVAGKDRTGVGAALLLDALGVPRETAIEDYLLTEQFFDRLSDSLLARAAGRLTDVAPSVWSPVLRAERDYIETMFTEIEDRDGSVEAYLATHLGVDAGLIERLRQNLLEDMPAGPDHALSGRS